MAVPIDIDPAYAHAPWLPRLAAWHHQEWQHLNPPDYRLEDRLAEYALVRPDVRIPAMWIAHTHGEPLGSVRLVDHDMDNRRELGPWMASLYVHPDHRGRGIASALIRYLENQARAWQIPEIFLFTEHDAAFYARRGWIVRAQERYRDQDVTIMVRQLV